MRVEVSLTSSDDDEPSPGLPMRAMLVRFLDGLHVLKGTSKRKAMFITSIKSVG
jgi:hypothetical protein